MVKILTLFNVIAGGASIAGLYVSLVTPYDPGDLKLLFAATAMLAAYVLLVPGNLLERNVRAKIKKYRYPQSGDAVTFQEDVFSPNDSESLPIEFHRPFAAPPDIELIQLRGKSLEPKIYRVTTHKFEVRFDSWVINPFVRPRFRWIAKGTVLDEANG